MVEVDRGVAVDGLGADHAAHHIDDLQGGFTHVADHPFAAVEVGEGLVAVLGRAVVGAEHQAEARFIVRGLRVEGVARGGQQVDVGTGHVVDEVEVVHLHVHGVDREGVLAVLVGAEADGHFALGFGADDGVFLSALRDVEVGVLRAEVELLQLVALVEDHDGIV